MEISTIFIMLCLTIISTLIIKTRYQRRTLSAIFNNELIGIAHISANGIVLDINDTMLNSFGIHDKQSIIGINVYDTITKPEIIDMLKTSISGTTKKECGYYVSVTSGKNAFLEKIAIPVNDTSPSDIIVLSIDSTAAQNTMYELSQREERLKKMIAHIPILVDAFDEQNNVLIWNKECEKVTGYTASEIINNPQALEMLYPNEKHRCDVCQSLSKTYDYRDKLFSLTAKDKSIKHINWSNISASVKIPGWKSWGIGIDVTDKLKIQEELQNAKDRAEKNAKDKILFLAKMSHEIRTPMNAILGLTNLILKTNLNAYQLENIKSVKSSAETLLKSINDILYFSKLDNKQIKLNYSPFKLEDTIHDVSNLVIQQATDKGISLYFDIANDVPEILQGDALRVGQIVLNLVNNAVKFTKRGHVYTEISLRNVVEDTAAIKFSVSDTGIGMEQEQADKLFNPFFQVDNTLSANNTGSGLGLYIAQEFVKLHGGYISVDSQIGIGSSFHFTAKFKTSLEENPTYDFKDLKNSRVFIFDNDNTAQQITKKYVGHIFSDIITVQNFDDILNFNLESPPEPCDIIILDYESIAQQGFNISCINSIANHQRVIVTAPPAYEEDIYTELQTLNFDNIASKPIFKTQLHKQMAKAIGQQTTIKPCSDSSQIEFNKIVSSLVGIHILIAEDNIINQRVLSGILKHAKITTTIANNGLEALVLTRKHKFDAILMDIQMPELNGLETTKAIRAEQTNSSTPILAMTANAFPDDIKKSLEAGMNAHITKPVHEHALFNTLALWVKTNQTDSLKTKAVLKSNIKQAAPDGKISFDLQLLKHGALPGGLTIHSLAERFGDDIELVAEALELFLSDHSNDAKVIETAIQDNALETAFKRLHLLKGVAANLGMNNIHNTITYIEEVSTSSSSHELTEALFNLKQQLENVTDTIRSWQKIS
ncbi:MAG: response regulator [Halodesulfovibrio sp.]